MQTGLPVTGAMLTRSSRQQCFDQMQLVTQPYREPRVFQDYPNEKPLLVLYSQPPTEEEKRRHDHLLNGTKLLHQTKDWALYETELTDFSDRIDSIKTQVKQELNGRILFPNGKLLSSYNESGLVYEDFDSLKNTRAYFGSGCFEGDIKNPNVIWSKPIPQAVSGGSYQLLLWFYANEDLFPSTEIKITEKDKAGNKVAEIAYGASWQAETYDPKGWVLVECHFTLRDAGNDVIVTLQLKERVKGRLLVDELLVKPVIADVYMKNDHVLWKNGRHWMLP
jgi:hypothetical protein